MFNIRIHVPKLLLMSVRFCHQGRHKISSLFYLLAEILSWIMYQLYSKNYDTTIIIYFSCCCLFMYSGGVALALALQKLSLIKGSKPCSRVNQLQHFNTYVSFLQRDNIDCTCRVTLEKDPDSVKALVAMSQIMFTKLQFQEAIEYAERALSKVYYCKLQERNIYDLPFVLISDL